MYKGGAPSGAPRYPPESVLVESTPNYQENHKIDLDGGVKFNFWLWKKKCGCGCGYRGCDCGRGCNSCRHSYCHGHCYLLFSVVLVAVVVVAVVADTVLFSIR